MKTSSRVTMPRSPWKASPGCMKNDGVPVLAKVAAIFLPMMPDLPMPQTMTRPEALRMASTTAEKAPSSDARRPRMAAASISNTSPATAA